MDLQKVRVWDLPTRLFHWSLALLVLAAFVTGFVGGNAIVWHGRLGIAISGLLVFRVVWGLVGSTHARFAHFAPTPGRIRAYLQGKWQGVGHNPLGALSVFGLLALLLFQVASGLVASDDIAFAGPLQPLVSAALSERLTGLHKLSIWLVGGLVALHLAAIGFYAHVKKDNLVKPMLTGYKEVPRAQVQPTRGGGLPAFLLALAVAGFTTYAAAGGLNPEAPPPAPASAPAW